MIAEEVLMRHQHAFPDRQVNGHTLDAGGQYQWRDGRRVSPVQSADHSQAADSRAAPADYKTFKEYSGLVNEQAKQLCTLRGLLDFKMRRSRFRSRKSNRSKRS